MRCFRVMQGIRNGFALLLILASPLQADEKIKSRTVDCSKGQDPANVLNQELGPQRLEMTLVGTCPGFTIARDDVRVEGDDEEGCPAATASVEGTILVDGAARAVIACLLVTGEGNGVDVLQGSSVLIVDSGISGNTSTGVHATSGASVALSQSHVQNNEGSGVDLVNGARADIDDTEITGNGIAGGTGDLFMSLHTTATGQGNVIDAINLRFDSGAWLDGAISGPVTCQDAESSALINGAVPAGCTGL